MSLVTPIVADMAGDLLDLAADALSDIDAMPPERRFVAHSDLLAYDCPDQLSVHAGPIRPKLIDPRTTGCLVSWVSRLTVVLLRCVTALTDQGIPDAATLDAENRQLATEGEALVRYLSRQWALGVWPADKACGDVTWLALEPIAPQGGVAGWRLPVEVQL